MKYYIDESGTTGDLINKKFDLFFSKQPIFTHACIGIDAENENLISKSVEEIKLKHKLKSDELKCEDLYFKNPEVMLDIVNLISRENLPLFCEVMDKKFNLSVSVVNHIILPSSDFFISPFGNEYKQKLANIITMYAEDLCFKKFHILCSTPNEKNLLATFAIFYDFFKRRKSLLKDDGQILKFIERRKSEYFFLKEKDEEQSCLDYFYPIPDFDSYDNKVALLPNVHSFYYILARMNKYHLGDLNDVTIYHDTQKEYSKTLQFCCENIKNAKMENFNFDPRANYIIKSNINLQFIDSKASNYVQISDIIAGFLNRFINGTVYKNIEVAPIYNEIFYILTSLNRLPLPSPLGTNFVLPLSIQQKFMPKFGF